MTGTAPTVSVVLPAYNREASIAGAIDSVLRQSWCDLELIVVDDGSTDRTLARARSLQDPRLRVIACPRNAGPSAARNRGLAEARGAWIAFQDSDDTWLPDKLGQQMQRLRARGMGDVAAYCGMMITASTAARTTGTTADACPEDPAPLRTTVRYHPPPDSRTVEGDLSTALLARSLVSTQTLVARREALTRIGGFDPALPALEDWDCALRLSDLGSFAFVDAPLVLQSFSDNSLTHRLPLWAEARRRLLDMHAARFAPHPALQARQWRILAGALRRLGQRDAAREAISQATALQPLDPALRGISMLLQLQRHRRRA